MELVTRRSLFRWRWDPQHPDTTAIDGTAFVRSAGSEVDPPQYHHPESREMKAVLCLPVPLVLSRLGTLP